MEALGLLVIQRPQDGSGSSLQPKKLASRQIRGPETPVMIEVLGCPCARYVCYLGFQMENRVPSYITN